MGFAGGNDFLRQLLIAPSVGRGDYGAFDPYAGVLGGSDPTGIRDAISSITPSGIRSPQDVQSQIDMVHRILPVGLDEEPGGVPVPNGSLKDPQERADQSTQTAAASQIPPWVSNTARVLNPLNLVAVPFRGARAVLDTIRGAMGQPTLEDQATGAAQFLQWAQKNQLSGSGMLAPNVQTLVDRQNLGGEGGKAMGVLPKPQDTIPNIGEGVLGFLTGDTMQGERDAVSAARQFMARIKYAGEALRQQGEQLSNQTAQQLLDEHGQTFPLDFRTKTAEAGLKEFELQHAPERLNAYLDLTSAEAQKMREAREPSLPAESFPSFKAGLLKQTTERAEAEKQRLIAARLAARKAGLTVTVHPPMADNAFSVYVGSGKSQDQKVRDARIAAGEIEGLDFPFNDPYGSLPAEGNQDEYLKRKGFAGVPTLSEQEAWGRYVGMYGQGTKTITPPGAAPITRDNTPTSSRVAPGLSGLSARGSEIDGIDTSSVDAFFASTRRKGMKLSDADELYNRLRDSKGWPPLY